LVDIGCGVGDLQTSLHGVYDTYVGADVVRYPNYPADARFVEIDPTTGKVQLPDGSAEWVISVETIEHVENPRAFFRELVRLAKPGGWVVVTTPNQLSLQSKLYYVLCNQFVFFQERPGLYPSHLSALLEIDLRRMARENSLGEIEVRYTGTGRIPKTSRVWPQILSAETGWRGRAFSDNVLLVARKPCVADYDASL
jgi:2-polyprenyl-3-methyl-5-hydroxy-6-metoxy-1,4-benzoquinol methylase